MKPLRLSAEARSEINEAAAFYEGRQPGLGKKWRLEVARALAEIQQRPNIGSKTAFGARQYHLQRFSFYVIFAERPENILVVSFAHDKREPGYWQGRIAP